MEAQSSQLLRLALPLVASHKLVEFSGILGFARESFGEQFRVKYWSWDTQCMFFDENVPGMYISGGSVF